MSTVNKMKYLATNLQYCGLTTIEIRRERGADRQRETEGVRERESAKRETETETERGGGVRDSVNATESIEGRTKKRKKHKKFIVI